MGSTRATASARKADTSPARWSKARASGALTSPWTRIPMISFFPDLNVWLALSDVFHRHNSDAWNWLNLLPKDARVMLAIHPNRVAAPVDESIRYGPADAD